jgi:DNA polymerase I
LQATDIDVSSESAAGHGRVTCFSVYCGPDINFAADDLRPRAGEVPACVLFVNTYLTGTDESLAEVVEIWDAMRPFLESDDYPKV